MEATEAPAGDQGSSQSPFQPSAVKRKYTDLQTDELEHNSSPLALSSPQPSSPPHAREELASETVQASSSSIHAHKTYIAKTAPHVFGLTPTPSGSQTPSVAASRRSSITSDDDRSTPDRFHSPSVHSHTQSHHILPAGYRGPVLKRDDAEDVAPLPHLIPTPGSTTLFGITNFALNRNGWRYTTAGPCSHELPRTVFKTLETAPAGVHWCWSDRSQFTKYSADAATVCTDKGFRSARTNIAARSGEYYTEIEILPPEQLATGAGAPGLLPTPMRDGAHVRVGWARREAQINAPVGFDGYSYGYRDKTGDKVTLSRPLPYGKPFAAGDVIGLYIKLPQLREPEDENDPANIRRERIAIRYRSQLFFESLDYPKNREMEQLMERSRKGNSIEEALNGIEGTGLFEPISSSTKSEQAASSNAVANGASNGGGSSPAKVKNRTTPGTKEKPSGPPKPSLRPVPRLDGSKIGFFVNGEPQGIAFRDLFDFRPLRVKGFAETVPSSTQKGPKKAGSLSKKGDANGPIINVKARENVFDDGTLGYYPFASMYGGARARLIVKEEDFRFVPPDDIEAALEAVCTPDAAVTQAERGRKWKPLSSRYQEHLAEMWKIDLMDEARAQEAAAKEEEERERRSQTAKERYAAKKAQASVRDGAHGQVDQDTHGTMYTDDKAAQPHEYAEEIPWETSHSSQATPIETPASPPPELETESTRSPASPPRFPDLDSSGLTDEHEAMQVDDQIALAHDDHPVAQSTARKSLLSAESSVPADETSPSPQHLDMPAEDADMLLA